MRVLFLLFALIGIGISGQSLKENFKKLSPEELEVKLKNIIDLTGKDYKLNERITNKKPYEVFEYKYDNRYLLIKTYCTFEGENKDLEVEGVKKWTISSISGKFLDVFPFWKKYVDENADPVKVSEKGAINSNTERFLRMYKDSNQENFWILNIN